MGELFFDGYPTGPRVCLSVFDKKWRRKGTQKLTSKRRPQSFQLLKIVFLLCSLVLKGVHHYWICFLFLGGENANEKETANEHAFQKSLKIRVL